MIELVRSWWLFVLRGVFAVLFGLAAIIWPGIALGALILLFGAFAVADGILAILAGIQAARREMQWWPLVLGGVLGIGIGLATFAWPGITALVLLSLIAAWAIVTGILEIVAAIRLRREIQGEWLLGLAGAASLIFGLLLVANPGAGALAVVWVIGLFALFFGIVLIGLGLRLRGLEDRVAAGRTREVVG